VDPAKLPKKTSKPDKEAPIEDRLVALLKEKPSLSQRAMEKDLKSKLREINRALQGLHRRGVLDKDANGKYSVRDIRKEAA
jgi:hypothetical protein